MARTRPCGVSRLAGVRSDVYVSNMTTANVDTALGLRVREAILAAPTDVDTVAQATRLTTDELNARLSGDESFTLAELVMAGGLLDVRGDDLLEGIA